MIRVVLRDLARSDAARNHDQGQPRAHEESDEQEAATLPPSRREIVICYDMINRRYVSD